MFIDVEKIYASVPRLKREDVQVLQQWIKKQPHLPQLTEIHLILFLYGSQCSIEVAKTKIDAYFSRRTRHFHIFERLNTEELKIISSVIMIHVLPKKVPEGDYILLAKLFDTKPENYDFPKVIRLMDMVSCIYAYQLEPGNGAVVVLDAEGFSLSHLTKFNLLIVKHSMEHVQEGAPVKIKGIHIINAVPILDKALALVKPLMKNEFFDLIQIHSSFETFYKHVPTECLPNDYGGDLPSCKILQEKNLKHLLENYDYFVWNDSLKVDETRRLEKTNTFGLNGTFKKLEID